MKYLTPNQVAKETSIPVSTIRSFIKSGLPTYKMGPKRRDNRIRLDELYQWLEDNFRVEAEPYSDDIDRIVEEALAGLV